MDYDDRGGWTTRPLRIYIAGIVTGLLIAILGVSVNPGDLGGIGDRLGRAWDAVADEPVGEVTSEVAP